MSKKNEVIADYHQQDEDKGNARVPSSKSTEYNTWSNMKQRCLNPNHHAYSYYGGRGIKIHQPWIDSFRTFYEYMGEKPSKTHSIDRINTDGNYEPGNVRWATKSEQSANCRMLNRHSTDTRGITKHSDGLGYNIRIYMATKDYYIGYSTDYEYAKLIHLGATRGFNAAREHFVRREQAVAKAYGGCENCYGKGYATVNDQWIAHDTDQDIGSPGGTIRGGNPSAMKFCTCERGKQLKTLLERREQAIAREAQTNAVAWAVGIIDELHLRTPDRASLVIDTTYKGIKNTLRDRYKAEMGVDPAPNYPVNAKLQRPHQQNITGEES